MRRLMMMTVVGLATLLCGGGVAMAHGYHGYGHHGQRGFHAPYRVGVGYAPRYYAPGCGLGGYGGYGGGYGVGYGGAYGAYGGYGGYGGYGPYGAAYGAYPGVGVGINTGNFGLWYQQ